MCNNKELLVQYNDKDRVSVSLEDGHSLEALGSGKIILKRLFRSVLCQMYCVFPNYLLICSVCPKQLYLER